MINKTHNHIVSDIFKLKEERRKKSTQIINENTEAIRKNNEEMEKLIEIQNRLKGQTIETITETGEATKQTPIWWRPTATSLCGNCPTRLWHFMLNATDACYTPRFKKPCSLAFTIAFELESFNAEKW